MKFKRLINKYSVPLTITRVTTTTSGARASKSTEQYTTDRCAVFNPKPEDIEYYEALQYVNNGLKIYAPDDLTAIRQSDNQEISFELEKQDIIEFQGESYEVSEKGDRTTYSDFLVYMAIKEVV